MNAENATFAIEARGLAKRFGKTTALAGVDLTARAGCSCSSPGAASRCGSCTTGTPRRGIRGCARWGGSTVRCTPARWGGWTARRPNSGSRGSASSPAPGPSSTRWPAPPALDAAAQWTEHPPLAAVLDACARSVLRRSAPTQPPGNVGSTADRAELAARLLGAAHAVRGAFDESSVHAPQAHDAARTALGQAAFDAAYRSAADSTYHSAIDLARAALSEN